MTYRALKYVAKGLLSGDGSLPREDDILKALLGMAYNHITNKCSVLNLLTLDKSAEIHRLGVGKHMIRKPDMPTDDDSELDIDDDLGYVAASLIASYVSENKVAVNQKRAQEGINDYNAKVTEILESLELQEDGTYDT